MATDHSAEVEVSLPTVADALRPVLVILSDGKPRTRVEITRESATLLSLRAEQIERRFLIGRVRKVWDVRVTWALIHLRKAGAVEKVDFGRYAATSRGVELLGQRVAGITLQDLRRYPEYLQSLNPAQVGAEHDGSSDSAAEGSERERRNELSATPEERIQAAYQEFDAQLAEDVLDRVRECSDAFFEDLVVKLMLAMGYGGSREDAGRRLGRTGDHGVDGVINEDRLGLDVIYLQAKRWSGNVGEKEIRDFIGALSTKKANKGVFLTTSDFTKPAVEAARATSYKVILLNGRDVARLMIDYNVGVSVRQKFEIKGIDLDFFNEEDEA